MVGLKRFESLNPGDNKEMDETWMHTVIYSALGLLSHIRNLRINITEKTAWMEILSEIKLGCLLANMKWPCIEYMGCADTFTTLDISQINIGILLLELTMSL